MSTHPPIPTPWPPAPGSHRDTHPLDSLLRGVTKRVLYALAPHQRDDYVHYALIENADLADDPSSDVLLTAHVARQARDRELAWPLTLVCSDEQLKDEAHLDALYAEMSDVLRQQIDQARVTAVLAHEQFLLEKLDAAWRRLYRPRHLLADPN